METQQVSVRSWISDGIMIAVMTATAYIWALAYEVGFCNYFYIPFSFISLNPITILAIAGGIIIVTASMALLFIIPGIILAPLIRLGTRSISGTIILAASLILLIFVSMMITDRELWKYQILGEILLALLIMIFFIWPLFTQRGKGSYKEKLAAELKRHQEPRSSRPQTLSYTKAFLIVLYIFIFVCSGIYIAFNLGRDMARDRRFFLVLPKSAEVPEEVAVLTAYGDYLITSPIDRSTKPVTVNKTLYLLKMSEIGKTPLTFENVGPLKIKESPNTVP